ELFRISLQLRSYAVERNEAGFNLGHTPSDGRMLSPRRIPIAGTAIGLLEPLGLLACISFQTPQLVQVADRLRPHRPRDQAAIVCLQGLDRLPAFLLGKPAIVSLGVVASDLDQLGDLAELLRISQLLEQTLRLADMLQRFRGLGVLPIAQDVSERVLEVG